jgi:hypothetical protein
MTEMCRGPIRRREFLRLGTLALGGLSLADFLKLRASAGEPARDMVFGGGLRMGQVVGATNSRGEYPAERPLSPQDLLATIYRHLGIDTRAEFRDFAGRPFPILFGGEPIRELI